MFFLLFCMMIEGSGSGSIPLTRGSGSGFWRPENMWIRWIRIRNTGSFSKASRVFLPSCTAVSSFLSTEFRFLILVLERFFVILFATV
jgi:hypothetical protein